MAASQFIALLESRGLLDPEIIAELHRQVEQSKVRVTPEAIARLLVDNGQLTRFQATKLVTELNEQLGSSRPDPSVALRGGRPLDPQPNDHDSVEDLLPDDLVEVDEVAEPVEILDDAEPVEIVEVVSNAPARPAESTIPRNFEEAPRRVVRSDAKSKSAWESFRILGYSFIVLLLLIFFIPLFWWFSKGSADEAFTSAEELYKARDYERSTKAYSDFAKNFSSDQRASQARVLSAIGKVRQDAERTADPTVALKSSQEILPSISNEQAMVQLRGDVTDTLLKISEKFVTKISNTSSIPERKALLEKMQEQMLMIADPRYVGTQERTQNELRIRKIEEDRNRLARDIQRGEDLAVTVQAMEASVAEKDVVKTYELRRALIRKYPQLETEAKVNGLLSQATTQQKDKVLPVSKLPVVSNEEPPKASIGKQALLIGRRASDLDKTSGTTVFLRIEGAIVALNAANGKVIWRQYVGRDWSGTPKRLTNATDSDVLIPLPEQGLLRRLAAKDGSLIWEVKFDGRIIEPSVESEDIFVSTLAGELYCLDPVTGQARWGKKIPQPSDVGISTTGKKKRYLVGNHSNLYAISKASGVCDEVHYIGHNASTIVVPPVWILNQLVVFENEGSDYSLMRIFSTDEDGLKIQPGQKPIRLRGHVVVEPQVDGRRIAVATNLGETVIFDVDSLNPNDKIVKLVSTIENETSPKKTWPLMVGNDLWLAANRLTYYQVQVTSQKLNQKWVLSDGDAFTARPLIADDLVIHSRVVRGNLGVRVTATKPTVKGETVWETDIGVPVTSVSSDGKGFLALTAQGAVYSLEGSSFGSNASIDSMENLGRNQRFMQFLSPLPLKDSRIAVLNQARGSDAGNQGSQNQLLLLDPSKRTVSPSRILTLNLGEASPSTEPIVLGSGAILVPLDNAQVAMIDPDKGTSIGTPFQPTVQAGERPVWLNPVALSDNQNVIIADQKRFMYKLTTGKQLRPIAQQSLEKPLKGRLSIIKDVVVGVSSNASGDQLDFYDSIELRRTASLPVEGRFAWGPYVLNAGDSSYVLALSDIEGLIATDEAGKKLWSINLEQIVLVGKPVALESDGLIATTTGELIRIGLANGSVIARVNVGEPISGSPLVLPRGLIVPCQQGSVLTVPMPTAQTVSSGAN